MPDDHLSLDPDDVVVVAALGVEARAVEKLAPGLHVIRAGVALAALDRSLLASSVVLSVGLAGGLTDDLVSGTVVVPTTVAHEGGASIACDPAWTEALERASRRLGFPTSAAPLLSADALVTNAGRARWAARGFVAADMETALLAETVARVAAVRVVLDTPHREISPAWERPGRAAMNPLLWRQGAWLMRAAPRFCRRAAMVVAAALEEARARRPA
jgi:hypothetical protein